MKGFSFHLPKVRRLAMVAVLTALVSYGGIVGYLMAIENRYIYFPSPYPEGAWDMKKFRVSSGIEGKVEDCRFRAEDGINLHGWWIHRHEPGKEGTESLPLLIWFHGNAGNLTFRMEMARSLLKLPLEIFIFDYRGYGRSEGIPNEEGLYRDGVAAWNFLTQRGVAPGRIVLFGKSLGGGVATYLAGKVQPAAMILQSTFTSMPNMAAIHMPIVPKFLVRTRMNSLDRVPGLHCPTLVIHGTHDEIVPFQMGKDLFKAAGGQKEFLPVEGAGHNDVWLQGGREYLAAIGLFLSKYVKTPILSTDYTD